MNKIDDKFIEYFWWLKKHLPLTFIALKVLSTNSAFVRNLSLLVSKWLNNCCCMGWSIEWAAYSAKVSFPFPLEYIRLFFQSANSAYEWLLNSARCKSYNKSCNTFYKVILLCSHDNFFCKTRAIYCCWTSNLKNPNLTDSLDSEYWILKYTDIVPMNTTWQCVK